jgi:phosphoribosylanthranilate isomerase
MSLRTTVYVGNITNLSDARYCAGMGSELLGFPIDPIGSNYLSQDEFKEISGWLAGVQKVGEIDVEVPNGYAVDYFKFSNPSLVDEVNKTGIPYIFAINAQNSLQELASIVNYVQPAFFILENCQVDAIDHIAQIIQTTSTPVLVGYDIQPEDAEKYEAVSAKGLALLGSKEEKPGFKDYDALADVLEYLEV